jgi:branched-chain amino acid transport system ATP-binding protein
MTSAARAEVVRTDRLTKAFHGVAALADVSLTVREREVVGIIGPNGAGKTTLFNLVAGAVKPTSGTVYLRGRNITSKAAHRRLRLGIARTFQHIKPFGSMTVRENVEVGATGSGASRRVARARADRLIDELRLGGLADLSAGEVNAVEGKRLELARALATDPSVILLDEIFTGLNEEEADDLARSVRSLPGAGLTVLMVEHNIGAVRAVAERVLAFTAGRLVAEGDPDTVLKNPDVVESYLGSRTRP